MKKTIITLTILGIISANVSFGAQQIWEFYGDKGVEVSCPNNYLHLVWGGTCVDISGTKYYKEKLNPIGITFNWSQLYWWK